LSAVTLRCTCVLIGVVYFMDCNASLDPLALPLVTAYVEHGDAGLKVRNVPVEYTERSGRSKVTGTIGGTARAVKDMAQILREIR
jgi:hypothetical protein